MQPALFVSTSAELLHALGLLDGGGFVALDTEFMRESTYFPRLCLLQAATAQGCVLIDPLADLDLSPLWTWLSDRKRLKVLHAARQDLEVLSVAMHGAPLPGPIFDTQIAAALLGCPAQIGYGSLVAERLGPTLAKGHTRTDWTRRPLSEEQMQYAADDVRYLVPLYENLRTSLESAGRLPWLFEETQEFEHAEVHRTDPEVAWRRLKGIDRLQPRQRAAIKLLARWREEMAVRSDKPRGWILPDEALREIAERLPEKLTDLEQIRSLQPGVVRRRGTEILSIVENAREAAATEAAAVTPQRPDPQAIARVSQLLNYTRSHAEQLKISPELLATRRDVEQLVFSSRAEHLLTGWRREVIGERLVEMASQRT